MVYKIVENITTFDGHSLELVIFSPQKPTAKDPGCTGVVLCLHGVTEYFERYEHLAQVTCQSGKAFAGFNMRGHGPLCPTPGRIECLEALVLDTVLVLQALKALFSALPSHAFGLFGHSFGGLVATYTASVLQNGLEHLFLCAPGYTIRQKIPAWKLWVGHYGASLLPWLKVPLGFNPDDISNNPENNTFYANDEHILRYLTAHAGNVILNAMKPRNLDNAMHQICAQTTVLLAGDDRVVDNVGIRERLQLCSSLKPICEIPTAGHEIFNETPPIRQQAYGIYKNWLSSL